jgi:hypothetical protein
MKSSQPYVTLLVGLMGSLVARAGIAAPDVPMESQSQQIQPLQPASPPPASAQPALVQSVPPAEVQASESPSAGRGLLLAGILTATAGTAAGIGCGLVFAMKARSLTEDEARLVDRGQIAEAKSSSDRAKTYRTLAYTMYGVGAAAFVAGNVLIVWGIVRHVTAASASPEPRVALVPMLAPGVGGAAISARF